MWDYKRGRPNYVCTYFWYEGTELSSKLKIFGELLRGLQYYCCLIPYTGNLWWGKFWQIVSYSPKFSSPIFTGTLKMYLAYALTVAYLPNFSLPIAFTCMAHQNFSSTSRLVVLLLLHNTLVVQLYNNNNDLLYCLLFLKLW